MVEPGLIHPSVEIEDDVLIGSRTRIWARSHIRRGARIGADCVIGEDVFIDVGVRIGDRCKVQNQALLYRGVSIEDEVFIGPQVCITNDRWPRATTPHGTLKTDADWTVDPVRIGCGASIGAATVVVAGADIGEHALVGAGTVIVGDVAPHALVVGSPGRAIGWVCTCDCRLDESFTCPACGRAYPEIAGHLGPWAPRRRDA
jgi:acetyltransferase-like isoleucine patch superfamily enzyme